MWHPTNANDVTLIVSRVERDEDGTRTGATTIGTSAAITVDDFELGTEEDLEGLSGIGNSEPLGISRGDIEHTFSFMVQGEDADLFQDLASDETGRSVELEILIRAEDYKDKMVGARAGTRTYSGSSGDPTEFQVEGIATGRDQGTV